MAHTLKPATIQQVADVRHAVELLRTSRNLLVSADCPRSAERVRLALKSAEGALRHIEHRELQTSGR